MRRIPEIAVLFSLIVMTITSCTCNNSRGGDNTDDTNTIASPATINYTVVNVYPHDTSFFTQGLIWYNNELYEGTGKEGRSKVMKIDIKTGKPILSRSIGDTEFGEGITILNNKLYQLTWQNNKVHVYDLKNLDKVGEFSWPFEGWGITHDGQNLIISTGSNNLYFVDPETFKIIKSVGVNNNYGPVNNLNELEYVDGYVYSNVWGADYILKINPQSGRVEGILSLGDIYEKSGVRDSLNAIPDRHEDVLNGIAYDPAKKSFFVTGKQWPVLFEIKFN